MELVDVGLGLTSTLVGLELFSAVGSTVVELEGVEEAGSFTLGSKKELAPLLEESTSDVFDGPLIPSAGGGAGVASVGGLAALFSGGVLGVLGSAGGATVVVLAGDGVVGVLEPLCRGRVSGIEPSLTVDLVLGSKKSSALLAGSCLRTIPSSSGF